MVDRCVGLGSENSTGTLILELLFALTGCAFISYATFIGHDRESNNSSLFPPLHCATFQSSPQNEINHGDCGATKNNQFLPQTSHLHFIAPRMSFAT